MAVNLIWRKSTRSAEGGGNCVELARTPDLAAVRDSKNPTGPRLTFEPQALTSFLSTLR
ncbi:DUF397 domain-containing protein [Lentzea alba]|uniref:DUF397 domain-containing protein n=1 Tax=Lentzea alba TaxID=2714351 RepID=UPI0039BF8010